MTPRPLAAGLAALAGLATACAGHQKAPAPPPPLRPKPVVVVVKPQLEVPTDCQPISPAHQLPAKAFAQRSIPESAKLAKDALDKLTTAEGKVDKPTREGLITEAVDEFITSLLADPYNVRSTYNLAAAYARVGRKQCAINMLIRLLQMKNHASRKAEVEHSIDRLLGRKRVQLDPDFNDMRADDRFRGLIAKMCEGSGDPECVFGTQPGAHH
jgi:hypothetical protein